jgi:hypothetical protein
MEERAFQSKRRYLWSFLIGTTMFLLIFSVSYAMSYLEFQRVSTLQTNMAYDIFSHKLNYRMFEGDVCYSNAYRQITNDFNFQRAIINDLEVKLGKNNKDVLERKKFYTLIELEYFEFVKKLNQDCNQSIQVVLFFYSNNPDDLKNSEDTGRILDNLYSKYPGDLAIYSFDINLNSSLMDSLKKEYNVKESTTIIVNNTKVVNPKNIAEIEKYLS